MSGQYGIQIPDLRFYDLTSHLTLPELQIEDLLRITSLLTLPVALNPEGMSGVLDVKSV